VTLHHAMVVTDRNQRVVTGGFRSRDNELLAVTSLRMLLLDNNTGKFGEGKTHALPAHRRRRRRGRQ
jgi:hypothetical protein